MSVCWTLIREVIYSTSQLVSLQLLDRPVATVQAEEALASSLLSLPQMRPRFSNVPPRFSHEKKIVNSGLYKKKLILVVHIEVCLLLPLDIIVYMGNLL